MKKLFVYLLICGLGHMAYAETNTKPEDNTEPKAKLAPMKIRKRAARPDVPGSLLIDIGWNIMMDDPKSFETDLIGSRTINFYYYYDMPIGKSNFVLMPGIGVSLNKFKFDNDVTLVQVTDTDGNTAVTIENLNANWDIKKSQLAANYIDIPLEIRFYANPDDKKRSFNVSLGGRAGFRFSSYTKVKYKDDDENMKTKLKKEYGLDRFRYGLTGRIGIGGFNVFSYYGLSEIFDNGPENTNEMTNMTVGISFTGF